jgi:hypothetical protein
VNAARETPSGAYWYTFNQAARLAPHQGNATVRFPPTP